MVAALDAVRMGTMSINQAAIHYHLPYSSLYGRINRLKREATTEWAAFRDLPDYSMDQDIDEADHSNGVDYSGFEWATDPTDGRAWDARRGLGDVGSSPAPES